MNHFSNQNTYNNGVQNKNRSDDNGLFASGMHTDNQHTLLNQSQSSNSDPSSGSSSSSSSGISSSSRSSVLRSSSTGNDNNDNNVRNNYDIKDNLGNKEHEHYYTKSQSMATYFLASNMTLQDNEKQQLLEAENIIIRLR